MKRSPDDDKPDDRNGDANDANENIVYLNIYIPELQNEVSICPLFQMTT